MPFIGEQKLWAYYTAAAKKLGLKQLENGEDGQEQAYSVRWYFDEHSPERNILTRAFLGEKYALTLVRRAILGQASPAELDQLYDGRGSARYDENDFLEGSPQPDEAQKDAIRAALTMPISFIKGPPGTGKTSGILHLLSCILRQGKTAAMVSSNNTAIRAVTDKLDTYTDSAEPKKYALHNAFARLGNSNCREAFENAHRELFKGKYKFCSAMPSEIFLASRPIIASTIHSLPKCFSDWKENDARSRREPVYDYVIVDESSQVNALLGLMAMGGARHLVLVGDDDQLPPVTDEKRIKQGTVHEEEDAADIQGFESIYALRAERSFLEVCREVFLGDDQELDEKCSRMLRFHYRCHPGIIGFCQREVYTGAREEQALEIRTRQYDMAHPTPIRVVWFEGKFCESVEREKREKREKKTAREEKNTHKTKRNCRQTEIFMQDEWPDLLDRLCADPCSVLGLDMEGRRPFRFGVLSPFKGQLWDLRDRLSQWLADTDNREIIREKAKAHKPALLALAEEVGADACYGLGEKPDDSSAEAVVDQCVHDFPGRLQPMILGEDRQDPMDVTLPELTVHKAQGQEYDVVYFLPADDDMWEWPWSQKKRLINVAVSRAKRELRIIASTALMDEDIQRELVGSDERVVPFQPSAGDGQSEDDAFLRRLIRYVWERGPGGPGPWTDGPFGFHRASTHSLFERAAAVDQRRAVLPDGKKPYPSAPEVCFQDWLSRLPLVVDNGLRVYINAPIGAIAPPPALADLPEDRRDRLKEYIDNGAHFDCVICQGERVLMAIEVDGTHHRIEYKDKINKCKINDAKKNSVVALGFGAAMYVARGGGCVPMEGSAPDGSGGFTFLRLPTDGTAWNEDKTVEKLLAERLGTASGPVYTLPVRTLADLPENRRWYVFHILSQAQDWNTGLPVREKSKGVDVRWVPLEIGTRRGLVMSYLPDEAPYWKKAGRLRPGMVCQADAWERLSVKADRRKKG